LKEKFVLNPAELVKLYVLLEKFWRGKIIEFFTQTQACARKRGFAYCGECPDNPCPLLQKADAAMKALAILYAVMDNAVINPKSATN